MANYMIRKDSMAAFTESQLNFDDFKSGGLNEKHAVAAVNLGTMSALV
jgi:hypothetical protein